MIHICVRVDDGLSTDRPNETLARNMPFIILQQDTKIETSGMAVDMVITCIFLSQRK